MIRFSIATVMSTALLLGAGCASEPEPEPYEARLATPVTTLEIDPTDEIDVVGWWSNGVDLLRLDPEGSYALFADNNHHQRPIERGRWVRASYAWVRLEPYGALARDPVRVELARLDGEIALQRSDDLPMLHLDAPPWTLEDELFGTWRSEHSEVVLDRDMRYAFRRFELSRDVVGPGSQSGRWAVADATIKLEPASPVASAPLIEVVTEETELALRLPSGEVLRRTTGR
jgi:hypothetical protein